MTSLLNAGMKKINDLNTHYYSLSSKELSDLGLINRLKTYNWSFELVSIALIVLMYIVYKLGSNTNLKTANKIFKTLNNYLSNNFARVGFNDKKNGENKKLKYLSENMDTSFTGYASGRYYIESCIIKLHMSARFNPLGSLVESLLRYALPSLFMDNSPESLELIITPNNVSLTSKNQTATTAEPLPPKFKFISAIVSKNCMSKSRDDNYFLSLTQTTESPTLPVEFVYMSEANQLNPMFNKLGKGDLPNLLRKSKWFLNYIAFTDLPKDKPTNEKEWETGLSPRCVISCRVTSKAQDLELLTKLINYVFSVYESITDSPETSLILSTDVLKKVAHTRTNELNKIKKATKQLELDLAREKKQKELKEQKRKEGKSSADIDFEMEAKRERRRRNKQKLRG
ncbi:uncharacterized protein SCDLUD_001219 [Saccharomycodes ludwigii]|uniref:uncharacterized protein n=1 Tax=Saccharomycodes ludwigii TaxID=36035 RepID=UPI001E842980|nr:hypothetical protein SCDLUD_001219 [Saccharomycodes ludwigii]KAH3903577.1 hypothetical protein SCDLUD_001219 [Saccharomycodes ludwigii]